MIHGTDGALRNSIHLELGSVYAHRILVCRTSSVRATTGGSLNAITVDPCLSHRRQDDPGSRCCRRQSANGVPSDDRIWLPGNGFPGPAGIDLPTEPFPRSHCVGLAVYHCGDIGHGECDYSIGARQCVHVCAWRELGDCGHLCAGVAGEQPADFPTIAPSQSLHQEGIKNGVARHLGQVAQRAKNVNVPRINSPTDAVNLHGISRRKAAVERHVKALPMSHSKIPSIFDHSVRNPSTFHSYYQVGLYGRPPSPCGTLSRVQTKTAWIYGLCNVRWSG